MVTKKTKNIKKSTPKTKKVENKTTLGDIIKNADQAVLVISNKGTIQVTGIKNINYAYEAKGLLVGAMDNYNCRPVINGLNNNTKALLSHLVNISNKVNQLTGPEKKSEQTKV